MSSKKKKLPEGWAKVLAPSISDVIMGQSPPGSTYNDKGEGLPFFQGKAEFGEIYPEERKWCTEPKKIAKPGDVLMSIRAPVGPTNIANQECAIGRGLAVIRPLGSIPTKYILYSLRFKEHEIATWGTGSTFTAINRKHIDNIMFDLPPLAEQERIVEVIKRLFVRVNKTKDRLDNAAETMKRFRKSVLNSACTGKLTEDWREQHLGIKPVAESLLEIKEERQKKATTKTKQQRIEEIYSENETRIVNDLPLTWKIVRLEKVCESFQYGTSQKSLNSGKIPVLRMGNLQDGRLNWDNLKYSNDDEEIKKYWLEPNTVLFNRTNSPKLVGKTSIFRGEHEAIYAGYLIKINNYRDYLDSMYLNCCMNTEYIRANCLKVKRDGVSQSNINATKLAGFEIALPPFEEQQEIVRRVERLFELADNIESRIKQARDRVDKLTQSILAKAFHGELVPNEAELARRQGRTYKTAEQLLARIKLEREKKRTIELKGSEIKGRSKAMGVLRGLKKRPILEVISEAKGKLKPEELFRKANFTEEYIDDFYEELRAAVQAGKIKESRPKKTEIYLEAVKT